MMTHGTDPARSALAVCLLLAGLAGAIFPGRAPAFAQAPPALAGASAAGADEWRLRIREAAVVQGETVLLGDIADPHGPIAAADWRRLAARPLWPSPAESGKPLQINRASLGQALRQRLGEMAGRCILPPNIAIQRGGAVWLEQDIRSLVVKTLTPILNALPGRVDMSDFRLPAYVFLPHAGQRIELEPVKAGAGRANLRFQILEVDGSVTRRFTGTMFVSVWADVPCAGHPHARGDVLRPEGITWMNKNIANIRGDIWDGQGGPWQATRSLAPGQPILATDLEPQSAIRRGDTVTLIFAKGNVRLSAQGEALSDGSLGETITVRNLQSRKQVFGVIRDSATIVVK